MTLIKQQQSLSETADELCHVAHDVKADPREIRLGANATETAIKQLSQSGELARYRVLHFATHGAWPANSTKIASPACS